MVNEKLWRHPAWEPNLAAQTSSGVAVVDPQTCEVPATAVPAGTGEDLTDRFDVAAQTQLLEDSPGAPTFGHGRDPGDRG
jgi:hypothetical protein